LTVTAPSPETLTTCLAGIPSELEHLGYIVVKLSSWFLAVHGKCIVKTTPAQTPRMPMEPPLPRGLIGPRFNIVIECDEALDMADVVSGLLGVLHRKCADTFITPSE